ncbi:MAG: aldo/keto reductase [Spirochaetaceae bacterium]|nr:MAG: aldo/keto reductase [Spirochaetaceae bacterium]
MENATLPLYQLGVDGPQITPVGLGTAQFAGGTGAVGRYWGELAQEVVHGIVAKAVLGGVNWFETSERYGAGNAARALASALSSAKQSEATPFIAFARSTPLLFASHIPSNQTTHEATIHPYPIGMYQFSAQRGAVSIDALMRGAVALKTEGRISGIGVSNFSAEQIAKAASCLADEGLSLWANRVRFNLLDRRIENNDVLAACRQLGVTVIACSPLAQGVLGGVYHTGHHSSREIPGLRRLSPRFRNPHLKRTQPLIDVLADVSGERGVGIAEVVLNWTTRFFGEAVVAAVGTRNAGQSQSAVESMQFRLSERELARIDMASREVCS